MTIAQEFIQMRGTTWFENVLNISKANSLIIDSEEFTEVF